MQSQGEWEIKIEKLIDERIAELNERGALRPDDEAVFRQAAGTRIGLISSNIIYPLQKALTHLSKTYCKKTLSEIHHDFLRIEEAASHYIFDKELIEQILDHLFPFEMDFYETVIESKNQVKIKNALLRKYGETSTLSLPKKTAKKGSLSGDMAYSERYNYERGFGKKLRKEKLKLYREAFVELPGKIANQTMEKIWSRGKKGRTGVQSGAIVTVAMCHIYLLLLPLYLSDRSLKNIRRTGLLSDNLLSMTADILSSEISAIKGLTGDQVKSRIINSPMYNSEPMSMLKKSFDYYRAFDIELLFNKFLFPDKHTRNKPQKASAERKVVLKDQESKEQKERHYEILKKYRS